MAVPVTGQFVDVTGVRLHYQRGGEAGASVMLLHGGGTDSSGLSWGLLLPELAQAHMVIAPDWPGYGQSTTCDSNQRDNQGSPSCACPDFSP